MPAGRLFESFDEAWADFLAREEPLESFYDEFTGGSFAGEVWLVAPPPEVKRAALLVQSELEQFDFLDVVPHHFLHVALSDAVVERLETPVDLEYANVTCFHTAVVAEVHAPELRALDPAATFLPHLTLAVVKRPVPPHELRESLVPMRGSALGTQRLEEVLRVHVELSAETGLEPWSVRERIRL
jgi:hypothetical protein